ncbi:helix-turn-helix domain-containing protein [Paenibacillus alvei]|uniref:helix-turn-helix domain-containing protein n=1 Tax=Paenibacillus alvei TaxID=44250 RepID=UPI00028A082B|nr:helix-turn-helix transcriptional regulator [Paenibacillus alvei]EJW19390.1 putative DNA-binding protein [Paenibacillus alvei DSM 29]MCY9542820.1 helix-turn-helix domain-containing protein [Paenibacillus alvei]MCY9707350.1 helix-turn-helix domain-containing protein [Paenibacillus alvei]MCY9737596.1 helix-turn-helix domain-containing protein [Paenibacillus alvei]MCY9753711.1 helix-turn-helix domain-containing protein [Paenibacillus alvei]
MDASIITTIGELIQDTRRSLNMTITQLSELSGVPRGTISRIENDEVKRPEFSCVHSLTSALNIPFETLVDYYAVIEKRAEMLLSMLQTAIAEGSSAELVKKVATKYLEAPNEDSLDLTEKLYQHIGSIEDTSIKLSLYNLIIDYSRSHGIMPYIAKGLYQLYLIERNDFSKLKETYYSGKYILHYIEFLPKNDRIELYYKLGIHAFNLRIYTESIDHCKKVLGEEDGLSPYKIYALGILRDANFCIEDYKEAEMYAIQYKQFNYLNYPHTKEHVVLMDAQFAVKKGDAEKAIEILLPFLETCSDTHIVSAYRQLLQLYLQQNNQTGIKDTLDKCKEIVPIANSNNPFICSMYGDLLKIKGECYLTLGDYAQCIELMVESASWYSKVNDTKKEKECLNVIMRINLEHRVSPQTTFEKLSKYFIQSAKEMEG